MNQFKNKTILVTGGTGSWGNELTKQLLRFNPKQIRIFSRGEINQVAMERKFLNKKLKFIVGDVRDYEAINNALKNVDYVFHLAALKHVPVCEEYVNEAIKTNIQGTQNIIKAAIKNKVKKVIDVSTDKACAPLNFYGLTKAIGEKLFLLADTYNTDTRFVVIRGGNALGSNGSAIPHFINQIKTQNKVTVTDMEMTRYFLTLPQAVELLFKATESKITGGIFVMKMPGFRLINIANMLIKNYGNKYTEIEIVGIRQGEKLHENLVSQYESQQTYVYNGKYYLIHTKAQKLPKVDFKEYASNTEIYGTQEIIKLLQDGGYLK